MFRGILSTIYVETKGKSSAQRIHKFLKNRPKMFPGFIGGHCVIPNLDLIDDSNFNQISKINNFFAKSS